MTVLDIEPLQSFSAVAAFGGVRRAAEALHLSPATVTGHLRRLEQQLGTSLVVRLGRGIALTADGEVLVPRARELLEMHDETIRAILPPTDGEIVLAATEYAADAIVPAVVAALDDALPGRQVRFRFTRSGWVRQLLADGRADVALMLDESPRRKGKAAVLPLDWVGAPQAPRDRLVVYNQPCSVRHLAIPALRGRRHRIVRECQDLTSLLAAVRSGEGIAALPRTGPLPDGLHRLTDLPALPPVTLYAVCGPAVPPTTAAGVLAAVRASVGAPSPGQ